MSFYFVFWWDSNRSWVLSAGLSFQGSDSRSLERFENKVPGLGYWGLGAEILELRYWGFNSKVLRYKGLGYWGLGYWGFDNRVLRYKGLGYLGFGNKVLRY